MPASNPAICAGTEAERREAAAAYEVDGGPVSGRAAAALIAKVDAYCE